MGSESRLYEERTAILSVKPWTAESFARSFRGIGRQERKDFFSELTTAIVDALTDGFSLNKGPAWANKDAKEIRGAIATVFTSYCTDVLNTAASRAAKFYNSKRKEISGWFTQAALSLRSANESDLFIYNARDFLLEFDPLLAGLGVAGAMGVAALGRHLYKKYKGWRRGVYVNPFSAGRIDQKAVETIANKLAVQASLSASINSEGGAVGTEVLERARRDIALVRIAPVSVQLAKDVLGDAIKCMNAHLDELAEIISQLPVAPPVDTGDKQQRHKSVDADVPESPKGFEWTASMMSTYAIDPKIYRSKAAIGDLKELYSILFEHGKPYYEIALHVGRDKTKDVTFYNIDALRREKPKEKLSSIKDWLDKKGSSLIDGFDITKIDLDGSIRAIANRQAAIVQAVLDDYQNSKADSEQTKEDTISRIREELLPLISWEE